MTDRAKTAGAKGAKATGAKATTARTAGTKAAGAKATGAKAAGAKAAGAKAEGAKAAGPTAPAVKAGRARTAPTRPPKKAQPDPVATEAERQRNTWLLVGTLVLAFLAYAPSLGNGFVDFDDPENVIDNYAIRDLNATNLAHFFSSPLQYMYTPLVYLSYAIDFALGGIDPTAYHVTNLLLHLANTVAVFWFCYTLTRRSFVSHFVTVAFALHPMNVDGVAWISTRSGLLATLFSLLALLAYVRYVSSQRWTHLALASVLFLLATLSKSPAVVLPLVFFLVDYYLRRRPGWRVFIDWRLYVEKIPFFAIALTMGIVALTFRVDTVNPYGYTIADRFFIVCSALVAYVLKLVFPFGLSFAHAYPPRDGGYLPWYLYLSPVVLAVGAWLLLRMPKSRRIVVFGLSFFFITIILSQTVLLIDNFQANRYAYLPYVGLFLILGHFVDRLINGKAVRKRLPRIPTAATAALVAVVLLFTSLAFLRNRVWHDTISIMSNSIENEPDVAFVHNSRGIARYKAGDYAGARVDFERTIALDPSFFLSYYYLGIMKYNSGDYQGALADHDIVVSNYPGFAAGYNERGKTKQQLKDLDGALSDFSNAVALDAYLPDAYYNRGVVELEQGNYRAAFTDFDQAITLSPDLADAYHRRGVARQRLGDPAAACADWDKARSMGSAEASQSFSESCPPR
jgi:protein O-mannosyl-transferase